MKKWQNIEELLNQLLVRFYELMAKVLNRSTPEKVKKKLHKGQNTLSKNKTKLNSSFHKSKKKSVDLFSRSKHLPLYIISKLQLCIGYVAEKINSFKSKKFKTSEVLMLIGAFLAPLLFKFKSWWATLRPETIALSITGAAAFGLTTLGLITSTQNIAEKQGVAREPAAKVEKATAISKRPHYYKVDEKHLEVLNIQMPVYVGGVNDLRSVRMDLTLIPSNRYIKEYLFENEYLVQDKLNSAVLPVIPDFTLQDEGKRIIKEKVRQEVNNLLDELQIKGEVEEVHVKSLLAN